MQMAARFCIGCAIGLLVVICLGFVGASSYSSNVLGILMLVTLWIPIGVFYGLVTFASLRRTRLDDYH
jgi:hypothetical protein